MKHDRLTFMMTKAYEFLLDGLNKDQMNLCLKSKTKC